MEGINYGKEMFGGVGYFDHKVEHLLKGGDYGD